MTGGLLESSVARTAGGALPWLQPSRTPSRLQWVLEWNRSCGQSHKGPQAAAILLRTFLSPIQETV